MSQPQSSDNAVLEHEREAVPSSPDDKDLNRAPVQVVVPVSTVDGESEPVVTRKELWSYYRTPFHNFPRSYGGPKGYPVYYNGDNGVGPFVSLSRVEGLIIIHYPHK